MRPFLPRLTVPRLTAALLLLTLLVLALGAAVVSTGLPEGW